MGMIYQPEDGANSEGGVGLKYDPSLDEPALEPKTRTITTPVMDIAGGGGTGYTEETEVAEPRQFEDFPTVAELPGPRSLGKGLQHQLGLGLSSTPEGAANIIRQTNPDARFSYDKYGNPIVIAPDENGEDQYYHLDKPGINALDVSRFATKAIPGMAIAGTAAALAPAATVGVPLAAGAQALGAGLSSVGEDIAGYFLGSEEKVDLPKAAISTAMGAAGPVVGEAFKSFKDLMSPNIFNSLPRGAQTFLKRFAGKLENGDIPIPRDGRDMLLDTPQGRAIASQIIKEDPDSEAAKMITSRISARDQEAGTRVLRDVDRAVGTASASEREAADAYRQYMKTISGEETTALNKAPPLDASSVVNRIDAMLPPNGSAVGKTAAALRRIRGFLVESEGTPGAAATRTPVTDPATGKVIRYETTPAQPGQPQSLKSRAQDLESARVEIDSLMNYGDEGLGIKPGELRGRNGAIGSVRNELSTLLKEGVPGYEAAMGKFQDAYALIKANELGQKIFTRGSQGIRPNEVNVLMQKPQDAAALRASARSLINERLRGSADDVATLRTILGDAQDNSRRSLERIFGKNEVNRLTRLVEREMEYRNTSKFLTPQRAEAQGAQAEEAYKKATGDVVSLDTAKQLAHGAINPVNVALRSAKGTQGPGFREGLSTFLTAPPEQLPLYMQGMGKSISADKAVRRAQRFAPLAEKPFTSSQGRPEDDRSTGGRAGRATGGAVNLMALANAAKKHVTKVTEPLLNESDDTVAHALAVAGKNI